MDNELKDKITRDIENGYHFIEVIELNKPTKNGLIFTTQLVQNFGRKFQNTHTLFGELGHPQVNHIQEEGQKLDRQTLIDGERVAVKLTELMINHEDEFFTVKGASCGPKGSACLNDTPVKLAPRCLMNPDGDITDIITFDVVRNHG